MKKYVVMLMVISAFLLLVGCGTAVGEKLVNLNENNAQEQSNENIIEENGPETNEENTAQGNASIEQVELMTGTGMYVGQADPHTIEIETSDGPVAFQLTDAARSDVDALSPGQQVTYQYEDNGEQLVIHHIEPVADHSGNELLTGTGMYVGQADPHTIEIETSDGPIAFQLTDEARSDVDTLSPGQQVTYQYEKQGEQLVIHKIEPAMDNGDGAAKTNTGIYIGQADPHTIEVETADGPVAFQLTIEARDDVEKLSPNDEVTFIYIEDGDSRTIQSVKPSE